jgi:hypothetical protein
MKNERMCENKTVIARRHDEAISFYGNETPP